MIAYLQRLGRIFLENFRIGFRWGLLLGIAAGVLLMAWEAGR